MILDGTHLQHLNVFFVLISIGTLSCFEDLDPAAPCYNLTELNMPASLPTSYQNVDVTLYEYKLSHLRAQGQHCEILSGEGTESDTCKKFYMEKLSLTELPFEELYRSFPGVDCVTFSSLENKDYGYCEVLNSSNSACHCLFDRDCGANEHCYAGRRYDIDCDSAACTRCLPKDDPPPLKP